MLRVKENLFRQSSQQVALDNDVAPFVGLSTEEEFFELWQRLQELFWQLCQIVLAQRQKSQVFQAKENVLIQRHEVGTAQIQDLQGFKAPCTVTWSGSTFKDLPQVRSPYDVKGLQLDAIRKSIETLTSRATKNFGI